MIFGRRLSFVLATQTSLIVSMFVAWIDLRTLLFAMKSLHCTLRMMCRQHWWKHSKKCTWPEYGSLKSRKHDSFLESSFCIFINIFVAPDIFVHFIRGFICCCQSICLANLASDDMTQSMEVKYWTASSFVELMMMLSW